GANLTNADFQGANLQRANFDPPAAIGGVITSAARVTRTKDHGYDRHVVSGANSDDTRWHRQQAEPGPQNSDGHRWAGHNPTGQSWAGHSWNGNPHAGAFDRYDAPETVTGQALWHHQHHSEQQQPGGTTTGTGGFTHYVISGNTGTAPQWQRPASGDADGAHHRHWLV